VGDQIRFLAQVTDTTRLEAFENYFTVKVREAVEVKSGGNAVARGPKKQGGDDSAPAGIALPHMVPVTEEQWEVHKPAFDKHTALRIKHAGKDDSNGDGGGTDVYDFFINVDNLYLKSEQKASRVPPAVLTARFTYGVVLFGLGLIQDDSRAVGTAADDVGTPPNGEGNGENLEARVERATRAVAPVLLPMIDALGGLGEENIEAAGAGEET
jgi:hypothetical protein